MEVSVSRVPGHYYSVLTLCLHPTDRGVVRDQLQVGGQVLVEGEGDHFRCEEGSGPHEARTHLPPSDTAAGGEGQVFEGLGHAGVAEFAQRQQVVREGPGTTNRLEDRFPGRVRRSFGCLPVVLHPA